MKIVMKIAMKIATVKVYIFHALMQRHSQPFYLPIISIIFKSKENLDNNALENPSKMTLLLAIQKQVGYYEASHIMNSHPGAKPPTGTLLLYYSIHFLKSPEKKWHRSAKMDKNKCPKFKSPREIL